ncbi:hypothetical protein QJS10_CPA01g00657 [Acorus calamus]|uniref:Uncharacterized protein n=1 Tax=Acorus calamus TaxID=4465 RepID=A0AAV9FT32_ACOCL|nr:hypothetical protein QJS10_CPA01g00657 [Acorus calamus]
MTNTEYPVQGEAVELLSMTNIAYITASISAYSLIVLVSIVPENKDLDVVAQTTSFKSLVVLLLFSFLTGVVPIVLTGLLPITKYSPKMAKFLQ